MEVEREVRFRVLGAHLHLINAQDAERRGGEGFAVGRDTEARVGLSSSGAPTFLTPNRFATMTLPSFTTVIAAPWLPNVMRARSTTLSMAAGASAAASAGAIRYESRSRRIGPIKSEDMRILRAWTRRQGAT